MEKILTDLITLLEEDEYSNSERIRKSELVALLRAVRENQNKPKHKQISWKEMKIKLSRKRNQKID